MSYEDQVVELLSWADPAREETTYRKIEGPAYLTAVQVGQSQTVSADQLDMAVRKQNQPARWVAAAIVIALIAAAGILFVTLNVDDPPVVTTPEEPVPSTEPEAIVDPEPTTPTTIPETTPSSEPSEDLIGSSGHPFFAGHTAPGDYEWAYPSINVVMTSDGEWRCVNLCSLEGDMIQSNGGFLIKSRVPGGWAAFSDLDISAAVAREVFASEPDLIVGPLEPVEPRHPDADWNGFRFHVDIREDASMRGECQDTGVDYGTYPCLVVPFGGWATGDNGIAVHGPVTIYVLTAQSGETVFASSFWFPWPLPPEGDHDATNSHLEELIATLRFVD